MEKKLNISFLCKTRNKLGTYMKRLPMYYERNLLFETFKLQLLTLFSIIAMYYSKTKGQSQFC